MLFVTDGNKLDRLYEENSWETKLNGGKHKRCLGGATDVCYSALFTNLVGWIAALLASPLSDVILAQLACPLSDVMFYL